MPPNVSCVKVLNVRACLHTPGIALETMVRFVRREMCLTLPTVLFNVSVGVCVLCVPLMRKPKCCIVRACLQNLCVCAQPWENVRNAGRMQRANRVKRVEPFASVSICFAFERIKTKRLKRGRVCKWIKQIDTGAEGATVVGQVTVVFRRGSSTENEPGREDSRGAQRGRFLCHDPHLCFGSVWSCSSPRPLGIDLGAGAQTGAA